MAALPTESRPVNSDPRTDGLRAGQPAASEFQRHLVAGNPAIGAIIILPWLIKFALQPTPWSTSHMLLLGAFAGVFVLLARFGYYHSRTPLFRYADGFLTVFGRQPADEFKVPLKVVRGVKLLPPTIAGPVRLEIRTDSGAYERPLFGIYKKDLDSVARYFKDLGVDFAWGDQPTRN